jgi:hypothetical protein
MRTCLYRPALAVVFLLTTFFTPRPAVALATTPAERIATLTRAAADPGLADWQREFYSARLDEARAGIAPVGGELAAPLAAASNQPVWSVIADTPRRQGHSLVYDAASERLYAFGGKNGARLFNTVFMIEPNGAREWHALVTQGIPPSPRMAHVAVFDAVNRRMLIYGGTDQDGSYLADAWALSLEGTPTWTELTPAGDAPPARANHFATLDSLSGQMIVYGGTNGGFTPLADLWSLSLAGGSAWSSLVAGGAAPTDFTPSMLAVDEARHRLVLFGVQALFYSTNWTMWSLPLDLPSPSWTSWAAPYSYIGPSTYSSSSMLFTIDQAGDRLVGSIADYYSSAYSLPLSGVGDWIVVPATGSIQPQRVGRAAAYDRANRRILVSGGGPSAYSSGRSVSDLASLDLNGLAQWTAIAGEPGPRGGHSLAFDPTRGMVHMFGGQVDSTGSGYGSSLSNGLWSLASGSSSPAWSPGIVTGGPLLPRRGAALAVDPVRDRMILFGGSNGNLSTNEVWQRPLAGGTAWTRLNIGGTLPHQRSDAAMVYDPDGDRLLVYGGFDNNTYPYVPLGDLWALSLTGTPHWTRLTTGTGAAPAACGDATLTWDPVNGCAYLVGGVNNSNFGQGTVRASQVWKLALSPAPAWQLVSAGVPDAYNSQEVTAAAFYDAAQGLLVRVAYSYRYFGSPDTVPAVWTLAPSADTSWTALAASGTPPAQSSDAIGVFDTQARRLVWFGGFNTGSEGTWALSFGLPPLDVPRPIADASHPVRVAPNPARASCAVHFTLAHAGRVRLELLDLSGRRAAAPVTAELPAGPGELQLRDLGSLSAGVYFARLTGAIDRQARVAIVH